MNKITNFFKYIFSVFNPKGSDGRLDFFLKSIIVIIYSIVFFYLMIFISSFIMFFLFKSMSFIHIGMLTGIIGGIFYMTLQSIVVVRRIRNFGGSIRSNLIYYNIGYILGIFGLISITSGFTLLGTALLSISSIFNVVWLILNITFLIKPSKIEDVMIEKENIEL